MTLPADARREEIYHLAVTTGLASVEKLSQRFGVTPSTIRRDLARLDDAGRLARTYGGAMAMHHPEASLRQRLGVAFEQKQAIARIAAKHVGRGESILLDGGSTVGALAHELSKRSELSVTTIGVNALQELANSPALDVHCLGGRLRGISDSFIGPLTEAALERMSFDRVFLGADAVTAESGICEADQDQTRLKELMSRQGDNIYVLADSSKLGRKPFHAWSRLSKPWTLITDDGAEPFEVNKFRHFDIPVEVVTVD